MQVSKDCLLDNKGRDHQIYSTMNEASQIITSDDYVASGPLPDILQKTAKNQCKYLSDPSQDRKTLIGFRLGMHAGP